MEEGRRIQGTMAAIEDIVVICLGTRENLYGQRFWVCNPLEWPRTGAGSLNGESGDWGVSVEEEDEPRALEKERKRTSMHGNNILGRGRKRPRLVSTQRFRVGGFGDVTAQDLPDLATDRRRRLRKMENRLRKTREKKRKKGKAQVAKGYVGQECCE